MHIQNGNKIDSEHTLKAIDKILRLNRENAKKKFMEEHPEFKQSHQQRKSSSNIRNSKSCPSASQSSSSKSSRKVSGSSDEGNTGKRKNTFKPSSDNLPDNVAASFTAAAAYTATTSSPNSVVSNPSTTFSQGRKKYIEQETEATVTFMERFKNSVRSKATSGGRSTSGSAGMKKNGMNNRDYDQVEFV